jgi:hypothetical protein
LFYNPSKNDRSCADSPPGALDATTVPGDDVFVVKAGDNNIGFAFCGGGGGEDVPGGLSKIGCPFEAGRLKLEGGCGTEGRLGLGAVIVGFTFTGTLLSMSQPWLLSPTLNPPNSSSSSSSSSSSKLDVACTVGGEGPLEGGESAGH